MTDWGVPDWHDRLAYPEILTDRQWWWEFTRRRPAYRSLWVEQVKTHSVEHDTVMAADYHALRLEFEMSRLLDPTKEFSDWDLMCHRYPRNGGKGKAYDHLNLRGYKELLESPEAADFLDSLADEKEQHAEMDEAAGVYAFTFNLREPLKPQLRKAAVHLQDIQDELYGRQKRKPEPRNWPSYLRILDARDAGASWSMIGHKLWSGENGDLEDRARKHHSAAEGVRDRFPSTVTGATIGL